MNWFLRRKFVWVFSWMKIQVYSSTHSRWTMFDSIMHKFRVWVISEGASIIIWFVGWFKGLNSRELNNSSCWSICPRIAEFILDEITTPGHGFCELSSVTLFIGQKLLHQIKNDMTSLRSDEVWKDQTQMRYPLKRSLKKKKLGINLGETSI